jgi:hypothetical protein
LIRAGRSKKLTIEHTLAREPAYRSGHFEIDQPELVVVRVLGVSAHPATPDVFRLDLESEDRIVLSNPALSQPHTHDISGQSALATVKELLARIAHDQQWCPATVACIHSRAPRPATAGTQTSTLANDSMDMNAHRVEHG